MSLRLAYHHEGPHRQMNVENAYHHDVHITTMNAYHHEDTKNTKKSEKRNLKPLKAFFVPSCLRGSLAFWFIRQRIAEFVA